MAKLNHAAPVSSLFTHSLLLLQPLCVGLLKPVHLSEVCCARVDGYHVERCIYQCRGNVRAKKDEGNMVNVFLSLKQAARED